MKRVHPSQFMTSAHVPSVDTIFDPVRNNKAHRQRFVITDEVFISPEYAELGSHMFSSIGFAGQSVVVACVQHTHR